ncbi:MAG: KTSC domain-containing protein [Candidatus Saccharimonadales bacterium]
MIRVPVNSSNILSVGYDKDSQLLEIEFNTKRVYRYSSVPPHVYAGLMKSRSHGKYFLTYIQGAYSQVEVQ